MAFLESSYLDGKMELTFSCFNLWAEQFNDSQLISMQQNRYCPFVQTFKSDKFTNILT